MFAPVGAPHAYVVPEGIVPVGVYVKPIVVQMLVLWAVIVAFGSTDTVTVNAEPVQLPVVGVIVYVAVSTPDVALVSVPFSVFWPDADAPPVTPASVAGLDHEYVVPVPIVPVGV